MSLLSDDVSRLLERAGIREVPRSAVIAIAVVALLGVGVLGWQMRPRGELVAVEDASSGRDPVEVTSEETSAAQESGPAPLCVHVVGAVRDPGVYVLDSGSRVAQAVECAGGLLGNAAAQAVNMARLVTDGEQILILTQDEYEAAGPAAPQAGTVDAQSSGSGKIDLNTADETGLETLPGIGPATAKLIVADREENGPFTTAEELTRVSGIGPKKYEALAELVMVQ